MSAPRTTLDPYAQYSSLPDEIRDLDCWMGFWLRRPARIPRGGWRDSTPTKKGDEKRPVDCKTGEWGGSSNRATHSTLNQAIASMAEFGLDGIGVVLPEPYHPIDFDGVVNAGIVEAYVLRILELAGDPLTWLSSSGRGLHVITKGPYPEGPHQFAAKNHYGVMLCRPKIHQFIALTGQRVQGDGITTPENPSLVYFLLSQILDAKFKQLFMGDTSGHPSASEADLAFVGKLARALKYDRQNSRALFEMSALGVSASQRGKAARYFDRTFDKILADDRKQETDRQDATRSGLLVATPRADVLPDLLTQSLTDVGNCDRLLAMFGHDLKYCVPMRKWFIWDGRRWAIDERQTIHEKMRATIEETVRQALDQRSESVLKFAVKSLSLKSRRDAIATAESRVTVLPAELDTATFYVNFLNGTLDQKSGKLLEHNRKHLITKLVHHDYVPGAKCPTFLKFLESSVGASCVNFVQAALGYSTTGDTSEKATFLCVGPTDAGKTTLLDLHREIFEEYSTLILIDAIMAKQEDNATRADLADLRGVRFAMSSETEEGQRLREGRLKRITQGRGLIKATRKYENPIQFPETHKLWIDANHKPMVKGSDDSIWARLKPVPFVQCKKIDKELSAKLRKEIEGYIAWTQQGASAWLKNGLPAAPVIDQTRLAWRKEMDRLAAFIDEYCILGEQNKTPAHALYLKYRDWSKDAGELPITEVMFASRMKESGYRKEKLTAGMFYWGLALDGGQNTDL